MKTTAVLRQIVAACFLALALPECGAEDEKPTAQDAAKLLDSGSIEEAGRIIARLMPRESLEVRYLSARLQGATEGEPAPDAIQILKVPTTVQVRYAVLHPAKRQAVFISRDGGLRVSDLSDLSSELRVVMDPEKSAIFRGVFSADGKRFFSGHQNGRVLVWNTHDWTLLSAVTIDPAWPVRELAASPDGTTFVAEAKKGLELWTLADTEPRKVARIADRLNFGEGLSISPAGDSIATGGMFDVILHDAATGEKRGEMRHASYTMGLYFSPDGKYLASAPRGNVNRFLAVFDVAERKQLFNAGPFGNYINGVAFDPGGNRIVATGCEKTLRIFDAKTGEIRLSIPRRDCGTQPAVLRDGSLFGWSEPQGFLFVDLNSTAEVSKQ